MSKNDFSTKLAEGIRRAKNEPDAKFVSTAAISTAAVSTAAVPAAAVKPQSKPESTSASKQTAATARPARKSDTSSTPKSTTDQPWENLHPTRIWPD